jgi:hypothetical protein
MTTSSDAEVFWSGPDSTFSGFAFEAVCHAAWLIIWVLMIVDNLFACWLLLMLQGCNCVLFDWNR